MQDLVELRNFYQQYIGQDTLVLCTLVRKSGSSYRDVGAKKIVALHKKSCGLLSGGCLEGSIEKMARERVHETPFISSFSTLSDEDRLLGYQTGCQGIIEILFENMRETELDLLIPFGIPEKAAGVNVSLAEANGRPLGHRAYADRITSDTQLFFETWVKPLHLVIIGCGPDADAYLALSKSLGWSIQFLDYRRDLAYEGRIIGEKVEHIEVSKLFSHVPQGTHVAVVLMTHNYEADLEIMRGLRNYRLGYLGCLGPAARYHRIKSDLLKMYNEEIPGALEAIVSAPAGIFSHSRSPNEIALSVVSQIQERLVECTLDKAWTLILAAGASSRFGGPKALAKWNQTTFLAHAQHTAQLATGQNVMIVTGGHAEALRPHLRQCFTTFNSHWPSGMASSIQEGVDAIRQLDPKVDLIVILPIDQPLVSAEHLKHLIRESYRTQRCAITINEDGVIGAPAALPRILFARTQKLDGDRGLKSVLQKSEMITIENSASLKDVDSQDDLIVLMNSLSELKKDHPPLAERLT